MQNITKKYLQRMRVTDSMVCADVGNNSEKLKCARNSFARRLIVEAQNIVKERYMEADISLDRGMCGSRCIEFLFFFCI